MSKIKERVYSIKGLTKSLSDGKQRNITVVGVVVSTPKSHTFRDTKIQENGGKTIVTTTSETVEYTEHVLSIGVAVVCPTDEDIATDEKGVSIAKGKALKDKTCLLRLVTSDNYFSKTVVEGILKDQLDKIILNPDRVVKISPRKPTTQSLPGFPEGTFTK